MCESSRTFPSILFEDNEFSGKISFKRELYVLLKNVKKHKIKIKVEFEITKMVTISILITD